MIKEQVGKRIKELRLAKNMSQEDFAYKCGSDRTYITSLERGKRNVSLINLEKIASMDIKNENMVTSVISEIIKDLSIEDLELLDDIIQKRIEKSI